MNMHARNPYQDGLTSCVRTIALAEPARRLDVFRNQAREAVSYVRKGGLEHGAVVDRLIEAAEAYNLIEVHGRETIETALADALQEPASPLVCLDAPPIAGKATGPNRAELQSRKAADIKPERVEWLWPGRLARGKHTCVAGEPGTGKSQLSIAIIAAITTGGDWPCGEGRAQLGSVIVLSAEDGAADTIVPRLIAAGADLTRVHIVSAVAEPNGRRGFNLQSDITLLEKKIAEIGDVVLVIVDPVSSYMGKTDSHKNSEVRGVLEPLSDMADRTRTAILTITHFSKAGAGNTTKALHRFIGSIAFTGAPRAAFAVIDDAEHEGRKLFLHAKNNLAPPPQGLAFRLEQTIVADNIVASRVWWESEPVTITANQALAADATGTECKTEKEDAIDLLKAVLANGPMPAKEVEKMAREHAIGSKPLRSARETLKVKIDRDGFGLGSKSLWSLPETPYMPSAAIDAQQSNRASMDSKGKYGPPSSLDFNHAKRQGEVGRP